MILLYALAFPLVVSADMKVGEKKAQLCLLCHKLANANAPRAMVPLLEAQPSRYLYLQTKAYKEKRRPDSIMQTNSASLSDRDMRDIADYLARQKPLRATYSLDAAKIAGGGAKAEELKCATCHLPSFAGKGEIPRLAGQVPGYLLAQLEAFQAGKRAHGAGPKAAPALKLSEEETESVAQFLASLD